MSNVSLTSIDPRLAKQFTAAEQALNSNPQYAAEIAAGILNRAPESVEVRILLRKAQKRLSGPGKKSFGGLFDGFSGLFNSTKLAESNPKQAIENAEKALAKNPYDSAANKLLAAAAEKLGWLDTAAFAYSEIAAADPKNVTPFVVWANALFKGGNLDEALRVCDDALRRFPGNGDLQDLARRASVAKTVQKGKWEESSDFKSKAKDLEGASKGDIANRMVQDAEEALRIAAELEVKIAADPQNVDYYREAVRNYQAAGDLEKAIDALQRARQTNIGRADAALEKQENELAMDINDQRVEAYAAQVAAQPDNAELRAQYEKARDAAAEYRLQIFQNLVDRYPNDYGYRYNLGVLFLGAGRNSDAIQQLQIAQRNPKNRHNAMLNLARAFIQGNKFDLAVEQLQTAKSEILPMTDIKKEIIYELGSAFEKLGRGKEAVDEFKVLYMTDASYRDVAQKIDASYASSKV